MAWHFDGINSYVAMGDHAALTLPDAGWTVAGWIRTNNNHDARTYIASWSGGSGPLFFWALRGNQYASGAGKFNFDVTDNAGTHLGLFPGALYGNSTDWRHVCVTCTSGGILHFYFDGLSIGVVTDSAMGVVNAAARWNFGSNYSQSAGYFWRGDMAEWAKWDHASSTAEVAGLAAGQTPDWFPGGLAWYLPMRENAAELVHGIPVKLIGAKAVDHPRRFQPSPQSWAARAQGVAP